jgi:hypothetical protein
MGWPFLHDQPITRGVSRKSMQSLLEYRLEISALKSISPQAYEVFLEP